MSDPTVAVTAAPVLLRAGWRDRVRAYVALTKPRIIELLLVTTLPAMLLAKGWALSPVVAAATLVGGGLTAAAANAYNCLYDRDIDARMRRTSRRPLVRDGAGAVSPAAAAAFATVLLAAGTILLGLVTNWLAAGLADFAVAFYVLVYTALLKRRTPENIVIGGVAGAVPVLTGWAAVTGHLAAAPLLLAGVVVAWTPPHFWALALAFKADYERAGVPMLPVVAGPRVVARRVVAYAWLTVALSLPLPLLVRTGPVYPVAAALVGGWLLMESHQLARRLKAGTPAHPMRLFHASIGYLTLLFVAAAVSPLLPH